MFYLVCNNEVSLNNDKMSFFIVGGWLKHAKIVSEYDQEIPQSQTADKPMAPRGRATQPS